MAKKAAAKKTPKKAEIKEPGVCSNCWRFSAFKHECIYFWENKSECSKFLSHQNDEERYVKRNFLE